MNPQPPVLGAVLDAIRCLGGPTEVLTSEEEGCTSCSKEKRQEVGMMTRKFRLTLPSPFVFLPSCVSNIQSCKSRIISFPSGLLLFPRIFSVPKARFISIKEVTPVVLDVDRPLRSLPDVRRIFSVCQRTGLRSGHDLLVPGQPVSAFREVMGPQKRFRSDPPCWPSGQVPSAAIAEARDVPRQASKRSIGACERLDACVETQ